MALSGLKEGTVTSKMNLDLNLGGKSLSVGGSCNLKRDEVIQLSLVAMGFMEVGRDVYKRQVMGTATKQLAGKADGKAISALVKQLLA